ncbi:MAG TPA: hypothetical protein DCY82_17500 [Acidimicrobiaceae bacterium]|nr:hypothetical protein [Acidimicrobiaceae bacterium]
MFGLFDPTQDPLTATSQQLLGSIRSQVMLSSKIASTSEGSIASSSPQSTLSVSLRQATRPM